MSQRQVAFTFTAANQSSPELRIGHGAVVEFGTRGGNATIALQKLANDESTWVPVQFPDSATAISFATTTVGAVTLRGLYPGRYRMTSTAWTSSKSGWLNVNF